MTINAVISDDNGKITYDIPNGRGFTLDNVVVSDENYYLVEPLEMPVINWVVCLWLKFYTGRTENSIISMATASKFDLWINLQQTRSQCINTCIQFFD